MSTLDLAEVTLRQANAALHAPDVLRNARDWEILNPRGAHALACGLDADLKVTVKGPVGYYCAGMNKTAEVVVEGHCGPGVAENMMSGTVRIAGNASQSAGATGRGGLLAIAGDAAARCGISMKGIDIVVGGDVGDSAAFMGQAGRLVVCGDAGAGFGDSLYEAVLYVRGTVESLGADCEEQPLGDDDKAQLALLLDRAGIDADPVTFKRYGSARTLYHFTVDNADAY